jgi:hypothetical protein
MCVALPNEENLLVGQDKTEFPPLFPAGFLELDPEDLHENFVTGFGNNARRKYLVGRLQALLQWLSSALPIEWEVWLNGSFCTRKEEPDDVDIAFFFRSAEVDALSPPARNVMEFLTSRSAGDQLKLRYDCDCYFLPQEDDENRSYWRGWFGFTRDELPKGIPRLWINRRTA